MVTIKEAKESITQSEKQLQEQEQDLKKQIQETSAQKFPARTLKVQQQIKGNRDLAGRWTQEKDIFKRKRTTLMEGLMGGLSSISKYKKETIEPYKQKIAKAEQAQIQAQQAQQRANAVNKALNEIADMGGSAGGDTDAIRKKYGADVYNEANKYYQSHKTRGVVKQVPTTSFTPTYSVDPLGQGISLAPITTTTKSTLFPTTLDGVTMKSLVSPSSVGEQNFINKLNIKLDKTNGISSLSDRSLVSSIGGSDNTSSSIFNLSAGKEKVTSWLDSGKGFVSEGLKGLRNIAVSDRFKTEEYKQYQKEQSAILTSKWLNESSTGNLTPTSIRKDIFDFGWEKPTEKFPEIKTGFKLAGVGALPVSTTATAVLWNAPKLIGAGKETTLASLQQKELNPLIESYNKNQTSFENKWSNSTNPLTNEFTGTQEQFNVYQSEFKTLEQKQKNIEKREKELRQSKATAKELATGFGVSAGSAFVLGGSLTLGGMGLKKAGSFFTSKTSSFVGKGLSLTGSSVEKGTSAYFKTSFLGEGIDILGNVKAKEYEIAKIKTSELGGSIFGFGSVGLAKYGSQKVKIETPLRDIKTPEFKEYKANLIVDGKQIPISKYSILGEKTPPTRVIETRKYRDWFGLSPTKEYTRAGKKFRVDTPTWVSGKDPFYVLERTPGSKILKASEVKGTSEFIDINSYKEFDPLKKFTFEKLAEYKTGGTPANDLFVPKMFEKNSFKTFGEVVNRKMFDINFNKKIATGTKPGKTETRSLVASEITSIKKTDKYKVYGVTTSFKDITFPGARASGKGRYMEGKVIELREPIIFDTKDKVSFISPSNIKKTPLQDTFQKVITKQEVQLLPKPIMKTPKTPNVKTTILQQSSTTLPPITAKSLFYGTGMYERTEGGLVPNLLTQQQGSIINQGSFTNLKSDLKLDTQLKIDQKISSKLDSKLKTGLDLSFKLQTKQVSKLKQQQKLKQKQQQKLKQKQQLKQVTKLTSPPITPPTKPTKIRYSGGLLFPVPFDIFSKRKKKKKKKPSSIFQPFKYTSSFTARTFGIMGKKPEKLGKGYAPGIRPIVIEDPFKRNK